MAAALSGCGGEGGTEADSAGESMSMRGLPAVEEGSRVGAELRNVQKRLQALRKQAMQDSSIQRRIEELRSQLRATMRKLSPEADRKLARLDTLGTRFMTARAQGDTARVQSLTEELQTLRRSLKKLQARALEEPAIARMVKRLEADITERMRELSPATDSLRQLADSLRGMIQDGAADTGGGDGTPDPRGS